MIYLTKKKKDAQSEFPLKEIKEEPPEYETKTGRKKKRDSVIGILHGSKNTLTGIVDVAMVAGAIKAGNRCQEQARESDG